MDINKELKKIQYYLSDNYTLKTTIENYLWDIDAITYKKGKRELTIHLNSPSERSYAPEDYRISFNYKDGTSGGGYCEIYKEEIYDDIDKFLKSQNFEKTKIIQNKLF